MVMRVPDLYLVEVDVYDPLLAAVRTLTFASGLGYRTDPSRQNIALQSQAFGNAAYSDVGSPSVSSDSDVAPDGTTTADTITDASAAEARGRRQTIVISDDGASYAASVYIKKTTTAAPTNFPCLNLRLTGGSVVDKYVVLNTTTGEVTGSTAGQYGVKLVQRGARLYWRVWVRADNNTSGNTSLLATVFPAYAASLTVALGAAATGSAVFWGLQVEVGTGMSDYIATTTVAVTRSNPNVVYDPRIDAAIDVRRDLFDVDTTSGRSRTAVGDCRLLNGDGEYDDLVDAGFDGRAIRVLRAPSVPRPEYPTGFTELFRGTQDVPEFTRDAILLKVRDEQSALNLPLQSTKYAGDNDPPDGLEGTSELLGKPKPVCLGTVRNVPAVCVNPAKLIYQVHDAAIDTLDMVYDRGIPITIGFSLSGWATRTSQFGADIINGITWAAALNLFVAVGAAGKISTSPDGITWTARTSGVATALNKVTFGLGLLVAVGDSAVVLTSPDGITWTSRTSGFTADNIRDVAFGNDTFVAVGAAGKVSTSANGTAWTARTPPTANQLNGVAFGTQGAGRFVAVGQLGSVYYSNDNGINWTASNVFGSTSPLTSVAYLPIAPTGRFVTIESGGVSDELAWTSTDGATWTTRDMRLGTNTMHGSAYANGLVFAGGAGGTCATSQDGVTWTKRVIGFGSTAVRHFAYGNNIVVAVGSAGTLSSSPATSGTYASAADLEDDTLAPEPGLFKVYLAGGLFRLGAPPDGEVTADVTEGATAADRTAGQLFVRVLERAGYTTGEWNATDITTLDTAAPYECGFWTIEETTFADVLDKIANSVGAAWFVDLSGVLRLMQVVEPQGSTVRDFTANDLVRPLERRRTNDQGRGLPSWRTTLRYHRNYTPQTTDLAAGVEDDRRALLAKEWLTVEASDADVQTVHPLAPETPGDTLLVEQADAQDEADRRLALRSTRRDLFDAVVPYDDDAIALDLGDVVRLTHDRFGLSAGKKFVVISLAPTARDRTLSLGLWGGTAPPALTATIAARVTMTAAVH